MFQKIVKIIAVRRLPRKQLQRDPAGECKITLLPKICSLGRFEAKPLSSWMRQRRRFSAVVSPLIRVPKVSPLEELPDLWYNAAFFVSERESLLPPGWSMLCPSVFPHYSSSYETKMDGYSINFSVVNCLLLFQIGSNSGMNLCGAW